jgi:hypothetical protein
MLIVILRDGRQLLFTGQEMRLKERLGTVAHTCNSTYLGGRDRRIMVQDQSRQKLVRPYLKEHVGYNHTYLQSQLCGR